MLRTFILGGTNGKRLFRQRSAGLAFHIECILFFFLACSSNRSGIFSWLGFVFISFLFFCHLAILLHWWPNECHHLKTDLKMVVFENDNVSLWCMKSSHYDQSRQVYTKQWKVAHTTVDSRFANKLYLSSNMMLCLKCPFAILVTHECHNPVMHSYFLSNLKCDCWSCNSFDYWTPKSTVILE